MQFRLLAILLLFFAATAQAQVDSLQATITVKGKAYDEEKPGAFLYLMVINQRTSRGVFGDPYGGFQLHAYATDTILISARGYEVYKLPLTEVDASSGEELRIPLQRLKVELAEVEVFPEREIEEIERDIQELGAELKELEPISGADALQSPLTALYQRFSKMERSKRKVAEMEAEDRKRELLHELFRKYIRYDIIDLTPEEFDDFIAYMNIPTSYIQSASQYDLIMAIKFRYEQYRRLRSRNLNGDR